MTDRINVSIVGASGYAGGDLLRILLNHPNVELRQVTSERFFGKGIAKAHPNLRRRTDLEFSRMADLQPADLLFCCLPHGEAAGHMPRFMEMFPRIIDLSADFRLRDPRLYEQWYGHKHERPELLSKFVYGICELHRDEMKSAKYISSAGCNATASILAMYPLFKHNLVQADRTIVEVKVGSSEAGNKASDGSHHPERVGCVRSFMPTGHRHTAEMLQELSFGRQISIHFSATAIEMVRGVLATCHVFLDKPITEKDVWKLYRQEYDSEPFIHIVKERDSIYRYPEPKLVAGTNNCDIGFELDERTGRLVVISAIDNLMKGAAGQAMQAFNIMHGFPETTALDLIALHP